MPVTIDNKSKCVCDLYKHIVWCKSNDSPNGWCTTRKMEKKIQAMYLNKQWEKLAPIFALYLYKVPLNNSLKNVKMLEKDNE